MNDNNKKELGQVFTLPIVAKLMFSLIVDEIDQSSRILDPCIGRNIFLTLLNESDKKPNMVGIEYDEELITDDIVKFYSNQKSTLLIDSFFNYSVDEKFDIIIQNPPYVRQELLNEGENSKDKIFKILDIFGNDIPRKSNLYVYFILKSILHLKERGKLVAIFYDSWLYSKFGQDFKKLLIDEGTIEKIIHLKHNAFKDIEVGATIIEFIKTKTNSDAPIQYYLLNSSKEIPDSTDLTNFPYREIPVKDFLYCKRTDDLQLDFFSELFTNITEISSIPVFRGTNALINKYFLFNDERFDETIKIIKNVSSIKSMKVTDEYKYLLYVDGKPSVSSKKYLDDIKMEISLVPNRYKTIKTKISKNDKTWYKISLKPFGNIIFNYYLRNNIDFILNDNLYATSDNFYSLYVNNNIFENFAILNSSFTKISILYNSRSQGNGLYKIQLYDFKEVRIINVDNISTSSKQKLKELGVKLTRVNRFIDDKDDLIDTIDSVLIDEFNRLNNSKISKETLTKAIAKTKGGF